MKLHAHMIAARVLQRHQCTCESRDTNLTVSHCPFVCSPTGNMYIDSRQSISSLMGPPGYPHMPPMSNTAPAMTGDSSIALLTGQVEQVEMRCILVCVCVQVCALFSIRICSFFLLDGTVSVFDSNNMVVRWQTSETMMKYHTTSFNKRHEAKNQKFTMNISNFRKVGAFHRLHRRVQLSLSQPGPACCRSLVRSHSQNAASYISHNSRHVTWQKLLQRDIIKLWSQADWYTVID